MLKITRLIKNKIFNGPQHIIVREKFLKPAYIKVLFNDMITFNTTSKGHKQISILEKT